MATMVALAASRKVKMALMLVRLFEILTSVGWIFDFYYFTVIIRLPANFFEQSLTPKVLYRVSKEVSAN